jgi:cobalt-zinc-cadmium efflux system membrane fusion protein
MGHSNPAALSAAKPDLGAAPPRSRLGWLKPVGIIVLFGAVVCFFLAFILELPIPGLQPRAEAKTIPADPPLGVALVEVSGKPNTFVPNTLKVPDEVKRALGIRNGGGTDRIAVAQVPTRSRPLVLPGSTMLDPTRLMRIRARFAPAEVVQLGERRDEALSAREGKTVMRELRSGDRVKKGDVLGVFFSVDVGSKKNDLIDSLVQEKLDQQIYDKSLAAFKTGALPEINLLNARRNLEGDRNNILRALNTLRLWNIPEDDIAKLYRQAEEIINNKDRRSLSKEERWERVNRWARVELKAPDDGVIVERNVTRHEIVQDPNTNLFQVARVDRLVVVANAPEDDLPTLLKLGSHERFWTVKTTSGADTEGTRGPIDEISYLIDPNQHTAVVKGHIDNPGGRLRGGQFISATIQLPPPGDVVEIPINAVVDDGKQTVVFVQPDPDKPEYTLRRVSVSHRFGKVAFVKTMLTARQQELTVEAKEEGLLPRRPLKVGERVLLSGVLELKKALEDLQSNAVAGDAGRGK